MTNVNIRTGAIILSGGAGTRVNGSDKGLQPYQGSALIDQVIKSIELQVDEIHICANRNIETYKSRGFQVHIDEQPSYQGPMSGISSALKAHILESPLDQVLILSCDAPHLPSDLRDKLETALKRCGTEMDIAIAHDGERRQNLHCLIRRQAWQPLIDYFDQGGRAMHRWFSEMNTLEVDFSDAKEKFLNINSVEQLNLASN